MERTGARPGRDVVVVLHYHGREDTLRCVASLVVGSPEADVLVVDNGTDDDLLDDVVRRWPAVRTAQTGTNLGFSGGMNAGLALALDLGPRTVTVLNNDTVVPAGAVSALADLAASGPFAVSPEVRRLSSGEVWFGAGALDAETGLARHLSDAEIDAEFAPGVTREVQSLAGCSVTASASTWRDLGGFDERFFLLFEDAEWSLRARRAGVRLLVDPKSRIDHAVSASFTGASARTGLYYYTRNGLLFGSLLDQPAHARPARLARFLRRHVVPVPAGLWRDGRRRDAVQGLVVVAVAVVHHLVGRYGRAPRWLEQWSARRA